VQLAFSTSLSEAQRTQALERFALLRPALDGQISRTQLAREQHLSLSTIQRRIKQYREKGLVGLANAEKEVLTLFAAFSYPVEAANQRHQGKEEFLVTRRFLASH
jgi:helix-turn-helix protein